MKNVMDETTDRNDPLVTRLTALEIPLPETLVSSVLAARGTAPRSRHRLRALIVTVAALAAIIAGNLGASYLSPRYAQALADAPGAGVLTGPLLQQAGLATTGAQSLDVRATASGYTLHLFGADADAVRTTVFVEILGPDGRQAPDGTSPVSATLTDQFGHTYHLANGFGMPVLNFEPLTGPAATLGARLTLHIDRLSLVKPSAAAATPAPTTTSSGIPVVKGVPQSETLVDGPWALPFTLTSTGGHDLALPPAVRIGDTTYTVTAVRTTASLLEISWTISGGAITREQQLAEELGKYLRQGGRLPASFQAERRANFDEIGTTQLLNPSGRVVEPVYGSGKGVRSDGKDTAMEMDAWYPISPHQTYTFQASSAATGSDARTITVP